MNSVESASARFTLVITWDGPGTPLQVTGPVSDMMMCYAMLEAAKDAVRKQAAEVQASAIIAPVRLLPA